MKKKTVFEVFEEKLVDAAQSLSKTDKSASEACKEVIDSVHALGKFPSYTEEQWDDIRKKLGIVSPSQAVICNSDDLKNITLNIDEMHGVTSPWMLRADMSIPNLNKVAVGAKAKDEEPEEWIWVEGYKGTDKDMKCRDFQFELHSEFYHGGDVDLCRSGYHFCQELKYVFTYYDVKDGNRFFKVRALVNKSAYKEGNCKDVAKIIQFTEELSREEIFSAVVEKHPEMKDMPAKYFDTLFSRGTNKAQLEWYIDILVQDGYSPELAEYFIKSLGAFKVAHMFGSQPGLSMDAKVIAVTNIACASKYGYLPKFY